MRRSKALILPHFARKENDNQKACYFFDPKKRQAKTMPNVHIQHYIDTHIPIQSFRLPKPTNPYDHLPKTC